MAIIKPLQSITLKNEGGEDIKYDVLTRAEVSGILAAIGATTESTTSGNPLTLTSVESLKAVKEKGATAQESTTGKNLFDTEAMVAGILNASGVVDVQGVTIGAKTKASITWTSSSTWRGVTSDFIPVTAGGHYYLSLTETVSYVIYAWYDANKTFISRATYNGSSMQSVTAPNNAAFVRYTLQQSTADTFTYHNIQLESGSTATTYEPYTGGAPAPSPSYPYPIIPLAGYDKKIVLDGTESWVYASATDLCYSNNAIADGSSADIISDSLVTVIGSSSTKAIAYAVNNHRVIAYGMSAYGVTSANEWKAYLAAHPLTVWYRSTSYDPMADQYYAVGADATNGYIGVVTEEKIAPLYNGDYVDFVSGVVHREKAKTTLSTGVTWTWDTSNVLGYTSVTGAILTDGTTQYNAYAYSNVGKPVSWANRVSGDGWKTFIRYGTSYVCLKSPDITTAADFNAAINGVPITVVYQLASPTNASVDLTEDLSALYGSITLNGNGTMDVTYRHG